MYRFGSDGVVTPRTAYVRSIGFEDEEIGIEKGLMNGKGDNNCFINAVIQALWHVTSFRTAFSVLESHRHTLESDGESCIFCCLKIIFAQYQFGQDPVLPTNALREAMSKVFSAQNRFELGKFADATECLEEIIRLLHRAVTNNRNEMETDEEDECEPPCFVHRVFRLNICEQLHCIECNQLSEPLMINDFVHYVYAATMREISSNHPRYEMDQILKEASSVDVRKCTNTKSCNGISVPVRYLLNNPEVFSVGIVWDSPDCSKEDISLVLRGISEKLDLKRVFDSVEGQSACYQLKGMICYYGHHYDAYFYNKHEDSWYVFDDAVVRRVEEPGFKGVKNKCVLGRFQPSLLFYERINQSSPAVIKREVSEDIQKEHPIKLERKQKIDSPKKLDLGSSPRLSHTVSISKPRNAMEDKYSMIETKIGKGAPKTIAESRTNPVAKIPSPSQTTRINREERELNSSYFNQREREREIERREESMRREEENRRRQKELDVLHRIIEERIEMRTPPIISPYRISAQPLPEYSPPVTPPTFLDIPPVFPAAIPTNRFKSTTPVATIYRKPAWR